jgi:hypothetical protein
MKFPSQIILEALKDDDEGVPESVFCSAPKILKLMKSQLPLPVTVAMGFDPPK